MSDARTGLPDPPASGSADAGQGDDYLRDLDARLRAALLLLNSGAASSVPGAVQQRKIYVGVDTRDVFVDIDGTRIRLGPRTTFGDKVLPGTPFDGQTVDLYEDTGDTGPDNAVWTMRYREGSGSDAKWEFLGGGWLRRAPVLNQSWAMSAGNDYELTSPPTMQTHHDGDYDVRFGCRLSHIGGSGAQVLLRLWHDGTPKTSANDPTINLGSGAGQLSAGTVISPPFRTRLVSGATIRPVLTALSGSGTVRLDNPWIELRPHRLVS